MRSYKHLFYMGIIGFFSAIPMYFLVSTMIFFVKERGLCPDKMGILFLMTFPYSLKILISAAISRWRFIPFFDRIGVNRFWAILSQSILAFLFYKGPMGSTKYVLMWVFCVSLVNAILDCVLESYRIQSTHAIEQSPASAANAFGWRVGAWVVGYVPLVISYYWGWENAFRFLFTLSVLGVCSMAFLKPLHISLEKKKIPSGIMDVLFKGLSFFQNKTYFGFVIAMILSYKLGDIFLRHMMGCYLVDVGCSVNIIAQMDKGTGVISTLLGVSLCGFWIHKKDLQKGFYLWFWAKILTTFLFFMHSIFYFIFSYSLSLTILWFFDAFSHFAGGIGSTAFLAYLAFLCKKSQNHTMICYGVLSSIGSMGRTLVSAFSGYAASTFNSWPLFFFVSMIALIPAFVLLHLKKPFILRKTG